MFLRGEFGGTGGSVGCVDESESGLCALKDRLVLGFGGLERIGRGKRCWVGVRYVGACAGRLCFRLPEFDELVLQLDIAKHDVVGVRGVIREVDAVRFQISVLVGGCS